MGTFLRFVMESNGYLPWDGFFVDSRSGAEIQAVDGGPPFSVPESFLYLVGKGDFGVGVTASRLLRVRLGGEVEGFGYLERDVRDGWRAGGWRAGLLVSLEQVDNRGLEGLVTWYNVREGARELDQGSANSAVVRFAGGADAVVGCLNLRFCSGQEGVLSLEVFEHFVWIQPRELEGGGGVTTRRELSLTEGGQSGPLRERFKAVVKTVTCLGSVVVGRRDGDSSQVGHQNRLCGHYERRIGNLAGTETGRKNI